MATRPDILGRGWAFPFRFSTVGGPRRLTGVGPAQSTQKVIMAIQQILGTLVGTRAIDRDFGSDLRGLIFEPIDEVSASRVRFAIEGAIRRWEHRVEILAVDVSILRSKEGILECQIQGRIIATNSPLNMVYSLYLTPEMRVQGQINV